MVRQVFNVPRSCRVAQSEGRSQGCALYSGPDKLLPNIQIPEVQFSGGHQNVSLQRAEWLVQSPLVSPGCPS